jgi:hypothetical protein
MRVLLRIVLCCLLAGSLLAQRRSAGGGGFRGGSVSGGFRGGYGGYRSGYGGGYGGYGYLGYPGYGLGYSYDPYYYSYSPYLSTYPSYSYPVYNYNPSPNVTVVYAAPQPASAPAYSGTPQATPTYDQYGQRVGPAAPASSSPIYLIATRDQVIRAAASYWVDGGTLHYVTLQREEKQVPLDTVDRDLSLQLNRERRVSFQLPR